ncbi:hypothetical protein GXW74_17165 [Roseomonas eburnea]|uniref:Uncharacterized protein n=1 Tax=Neoroseomonas eburnea TaxID=1346889 RepID=A0A9X9XET8_9PROT|nr:hypothetical protein [Neoroseomonas eburnea]MBR0682224.1 hypothetical protein [Neoroseomonas eburnea]
MALHDIDVANTQREWDSSVAHLVSLLLSAARQTYGNPDHDENEVNDAIVAITARLALGFKPPPGRPKHTITARQDALWLSDLSPEATLPEAIAYLVKIRGVDEGTARDRVLRAEKELRRQFLREKPFGHGRK